MNLSNKIAQLRRQMGWSQDELAQKLDVSRQAVYKWENGQSRPDTDKLLVLAKLFNVSVDNLLDDESEIVFRAEPTKKLPYGSVTVKNLPNGSRGSEIFYASIEEECKVSQKLDFIFKIWYKVMIGLLIALGASIILIFLLGNTLNEGSIIDIMLGALFYISGLAFALAVITYPIAKKVSKSILEKKFTSDMEHTIFFAQKADYEARMESKGYKFIQITPYLLEWLFVDRENGVFGFFFDGEEQFICPVQNFIDITGDGYAYTLKCYDEHGELAKYEIALNNMADFLIKAQRASALKREGRLYDDRLLPRPAANPTIISKSFDDLKDLIEFERSRLA